MDDSLISLIDLARSGDEKAFADLAVRYKPLLDSMARSYAGKLSNGVYTEEDFKQEATLAFYSAVCSYKESEDVTFGLYAKICVRNRLVSFLRLASKKPKKRESREADFTDPIYKLLEKEDSKEMESRISLALSRLEWSVFCLYMQKKSYAEIARELGKSEKTVDNALYRVKTKLKKLI